MTPLAVGRHPFGSKKDGFCRFCDTAEKFVSRFG